MLFVSKSLIVPRSVILGVTLFGLSGATSPAGWSANSLTFSESYTDKLGCPSDGEGGFNCTVWPTGKFTLTASVAFSPSNTVDLSMINSNPAIAMDIGDWSLINDQIQFFSDATTLTANATSATATFWLIDTVTGNQGAANDKTEGKVTLKITKTGLSIKVSAKTGSDIFDDQLEQSPAAADFDDASSGPTNTTMTVDLSIGNTFSISTNLLVTGTVATRILTDKSGDQDTLSKISLKGSLKDPSF